MSKQKWERSVGRGNSMSCNTDSNPSVVIDLDGSSTSNNSISDRSNGDDNTPKRAEEESLPGLDVPYCAILFRARRRKDGKERKNKLSLLQSSKSGKQKDGSQEVYATIIDGVRAENNKNSNNWDQDFGMRTELEDLKGTDEIFRNFVHSVRAHVMRKEPKSYAQSSPRPPRHKSDDTESPRQFAHSRSALLPSRELSDEEPLLRSLRKKEASVGSTKGERKESGKDKKTKKKKKTGREGDLYSIQKAAEKASKKMKELPIPPYLPTKVVSDAIKSSGAAKELISATGSTASSFTLENESLLSAAKTMSPSSPLFPSPRLVNAENVHNDRLTTGSAHASSTTNVQTTPSREAGFGMPRWEEIAASNGWRFVALRKGYHMFVAVTRRDLDIEVVRNLVNEAHDAMRQIGPNMSVQQGSRLLESLMIKYNSAESRNPAENIVKKLEETKEIVKDNLFQLKGRGDQLNVLEERSNSLSVVTQQFRIKASEKKTQVIWWTYVKRTLCGVVGIFGIGAVITFVIMIFKGLIPGFH